MLTKRSGVTRRKGKTHRGGRPSKAALRTKRELEGKVDANVLGSVHHRGKHKGKRGMKDKRNITLLERGGEGGRGGVEGGLKEKSERGQKVGGFFHMSKLLTRRES